MEVVKSRLKEVPVFRISEPNADGKPNMFLDAAEAEAAASKRTGKLEVVTLDKAYFDAGNVLQPSKMAVDEARRTPQRMTPDVLVPVFCIDGLQVEDKTTGEGSLPLFFSRSELLGFAKKVCPTNGPTPRAGAGSSHALGAPCRHSAWTTRRGGSW